MLITDTDSDAYVNPTNIISTYILLLYMYVFHFFLIFQLSPTDENVNPDPMSSLSEFYQLNTHPGREALDKLARGAGMEVGQVKAWFRNQRSKDRRKGNNYRNSSSDSISASINRVLAPPGGYPLPIVNKGKHIILLLL